MKNFLRINKYKILLISNSLAGSGALLLAVFARSSVLEKTFYLAICIMLFANALEFYIMNKKQ